MKTKTKTPFATGRAALAGALSTLKNNVNEAAGRPALPSLALCYSTHPKQPHRRPFYVSALPGQNGADWGYTLTPEGTRFWQADGGPDGRGAWVQLDKALPLSPYWQRRFRCDCERTGVTFHALPVSVPPAVAA